MVRAERVSQTRHVYKMTILSLSDKVAPGIAEAGTLWPSGDLLAALSPRTLGECFSSMFAEVVPVDSGDRKEDARCKFTAVGTSIPAVRRPLNRKPLLGGVGVMSRPKRANEWLDRSIFNNIRAFKVSTEH